MRLTTKQAARGKWDGIICHILGQDAISKKHTYCPICGGKDRYRYDNNRNDGDWFCNNCGTGDGFKLIMDALKIDFAEAARRVDKIVNNIEAEPFQENVNIDRRRKALNDVWANSKEPWVAYNYLVGRGIPPEIVDQVDDDIRGCEKLFYKDTSEPVNNSVENAMVALIRNSKGEPVSIHRTYIMADGKQKKIMPTLETITGGCIKLGVPKNTLVIAEGIETALAAWAITGHPAWATISAHGMAEFQSIPKYVNRVIICADNDISFTGQAAAFKCAMYMKNRLRVEDVVVTMPNTIGLDMLDVLNKLVDGKLFIKGGSQEQIGLMRWAP